VFPFMRGSRTPSERSGGLYGLLQEAATPSTVRPTPWNDAGRREGFNERLVESDEAMAARLALSEDDFIPTVPFRSRAEPTTLPPSLAAPAPPRGSRSGAGSDVAAAITAAASAASARPHSSYARPPTAAAAPAFVTGRETNVVALTSASVRGVNAPSSSHNANPDFDDDIERAIALSLAEHNESNGATTASAQSESKTWSAPAQRSSESYASQYAARSSFPAPRAAPAPQGTRGPLFHATTASASTTSTSSARGTASTAAPAPSTSSGFFSRFRSSSGARGPDGGGASDGKTGGSSARLS
jgi:hypothetical protein